MTCGPRSYPGDTVAEFCQGQASVDSLYYGHFIGTNQTEALQTDLTRGDGVLNAYSGNDVLYGSDRLTGPYGGEWFFQELGNATIVGAGGPDIIWAGEGNDLLDGGPGNDTLAGEAGSDTYIFRRGSGQDTIQEATGYGAGGALTDIDTIWLGSNLMPQDIAVRRVGNNLVFALINTPDTLTVKDYFTNPTNRIERIQFQDGTVWTDTDWLARLNAPSAGDDVLIGGSGPDTIIGLGGNDLIYGGAGAVDICQLNRLAACVPAERDRELTAVHVATSLTRLLDTSRDPGVAFAQAA
jgi:Ca2+-binding RTX toxin-like protein